MYTIDATCIDFRMIRARLAARVKRRHRHRNDMSDDDAEATAPKSVQVYIFNQTYHLRSGSDAGYVMRIAQLVDERMRQISSHTPNYDALKIAVLTALNIADEMQRLKDHYERAEDTAAPASPDEQKDANANRQEAASRSWFEDIFDSDEPPKRSGDRLGDRVSSKLQTLRQTTQEGIEIDGD